MFGHIFHLAAAGEGEPFKLKVSLLPSISNYRLTSRSFCDEFPGTVIRITGFRRYEHRAPIMNVHAHGAGVMITIVNKTAGRRQAGLNFGLHFTGSDTRSSSRKLAAWTRHAHSPTGATPDATLAPSRRCAP